jgi:hypothetical protein
MLYDRARRFAMDQIPRYVANPLLEFLEYQKQSMRILHMCMSGISMQTHMPHTLRVLEETDHARRTEEEALQRKKEYQRELTIAEMRAQFATKECESGFPLLHAQSLVGLWGAFEAAVEDALVGMLLNEPGLIQSETFSKIRVSLAEFETLEREERMQYLLQELKRGQSLGRMQGVDAFEMLFQQVKLSGQVNPDTKKSVWEMHHLRNTIVHRKSLADRRLIQNCPWLGLKVGGRVVTDHESLGKYSHALGDYLMTIIYRLGEKYEVDVGGLIKAEKRKRDEEDVEDIA